MLNRLKEYIDKKGISVSAFEKSIGMSNASFGKSLKNNGAIGSDKLENILKIYPDINAEWLLTGNGDMIKEFSKTTSQIIGKKTTDNEETRPRIPMDAAAGSLTVAMDGVTNNQCEQLPVIKAFARYDFTIFARGDSMEPEYNSGDELACIYIRSTTFIQWGRIHVIDTAQGILVKRIFDGGDSIICKSDNPNYPDFHIDKSEFYNIALVIGMIRRY